MLIVLFLVLIGLASFASFYLGHAKGAENVYQQFFTAFELTPEDLWVALEEKQPEDEIPEIDD